MPSIVVFVMAEGGVFKETLGHFLKCLSQQNPAFRRTTKAISNRVCGNTSECWKETLARFRQCLW